MTTTHSELPDPAPVPAPAPAEPPFATDPPTDTPSAVSGDAAVDRPAAAPAVPEGWQSLPPAAARVAAIMALLVALPVALPLGFVMAEALDLGWRLGLAVAGAIVVLLAAAGVAYARARTRRTRWRLDRRGLQVSRGLAWQGEVLVPRSRVQHLDIERGPVERRFGLATLVVHTAGTRLSALRQGGFLDADAVALRDALLPEAGDDDDL